MLLAAPLGPDVGALELEPLEPLVPADEEVEPLPPEVLDVLALVEDAPEAPVVGAVLLVPAVVLDVPDDALSLSPLDAPLLVSPDV